MPEINTIPFYPKSMIIEEILEELKLIKKFESFPDHICAQAGRVSSAAGFLLQIANDIKYKKLDPSLAKSIAITVAAQSIRFIENLKVISDVTTNHDIPSSSEEPDGSLASRHDNGSYDFGEGLQIQPVQGEYIGSEAGVQPADQT